MPVVARASLADVINAAAAQIVLGTGLDPSRVLPIARRQKVPRFDADQDILLRFKGFRSQYPDHRDRHDCRLLHRLNVTIRTRFELGEFNDDAEWLTDSGKGNVVAWQAVLNCLQNFTPTNAAGDALVCEPLAVLEGDDGDIEIKGEGWGEALLVFGVLLEAPLRQRQKSDTGWIANVM